MKYIGLFILVFAYWNSWGVEFICNGGRAEYEELKWDVQNYQQYSQEYKASTHQGLFFCQMAYGEDPELALQNLKRAIELGNILSNFKLAEFYLTGGWGRHEAVKNRDWAIWEFEKVLKKINAVFANYPDTDVRAGEEIVFKIYPNTLLYLISAYLNEYLAEGYKYYDKKSPDHYGDPKEAIERDQAHRNILDRLEYHIESCLADHEGQHMQERAAKRWGHYETISGSLAAYNTYYWKMKEKYCPHYKELLTEIREREATMHAIALNCAPPSEQATEERPSCADIKIELSKFDVFLENSFKEYESITSS